MTNQPTLTGFKLEHTYDENNKRQKDIISAIINQLIVSGNMPMNIVSQPWFTSFMTFMDPKFVMPSRYKVNKLIVNQFECQKSILQSKLKAAKWVSLTIDMWSDRRMRAFLGITVHFLNELMIFESFVLDCASFEGKHTSDNISNKCAAIVESYEIQDKIAFVVTDNAANMVKAFRSCRELFGDKEDAEEPSSEQLEDNSAENGDEVSDEENLNLMMEVDEIPSEVQELIESLEFVQRKRVPCAIHTLQLVVLDGLKHTKCLSTIQAKTSRLSSLIHSSTTFSEQYFAVFKTTVPTTTVTRWNSMFLQLAAVNELDALKLKILLISSKHEECILTSKELKTLQEAVAILEVAYDATIILEEEEALISMVGPTLSQIHKKWTNMKDNVSSTCETLVASLLDSLERRFHGLFENIGIIPRRQQGEGQSVDQPFGDSLYVVAAALDQQFGLDWVDDAIKPAIEG